MAQTYVIGRVTADLELKTSINRHPYVRFDIAENIGGKEHRRTQYLQICAMGDDAERLVRARVKKGSLMGSAAAISITCIPVTAACTDCAGRITKITLRTARPRKKSRTGSFSPLRCFAVWLRKHCPRRRTRLWLT